MHVYRWALRVSPLGYFLAVFERENGAAEGIFERDEMRGTIMDIRVCYGVFFDIEKGQVVAIRWHDRQDKSTG